MEPLLALTGFTLCLTTAVLLRNALFGRRLTRPVAKFITLVSIIFLVGLIGVPAYGTTITEYKLPGNPGPLEITMDSRNSSIFFTESAVDKIGRIPLNRDGTSGPLMEYQIPTPNCYVWGITNVSD